MTSRRKKDPDAVKSNKKAFKRDRQHNPKFWWDPERQGLIFCLKCKKKTGTLSAVIVEMNSGGRKRDRVKGKCSVCGCNKSCFMKAFD